jgi:HEAT repeat protein
VPADTEVELRADAVLALGLLRTDLALQPLIESAKEAIEPSPVVRKCTCMAIEDLRDLPRDDTLRVTLGQALLRALDDSSPDVRLSAARALARHADFGNEGLDTSINDMLKYMAQDLTEYGEPAYWVRAAARTACDARHIVLPRPTESLGGQTKLEGQVESPKAQATPK